MRFIFTCRTLNTDSLMTWLLLESFNFYELFVCLKNKQIYNLINWKLSTLEAFFIWKRKCLWSCSYSAASSGLKLSRINGICKYYLLRLFTWISVVIGRLEECLYLLLLYTTQINSIYKYVKVLHCFIALMIVNINNQHCQVLTSNTKEFCRLCQENHYYLETLYLYIG